LALPPPVDRHVNDAFAQRWQYAVESVIPESEMSEDAQLRKQYIFPDDSNEAQTSGSAFGHSPGTAQQSASD
jgi:hypothetical protein